MRKTTPIWTGLFTALAGCATILGAQTVPQTTTSPEAQITVTGCLKQGVMTVGTTGAAEAAGTAGAAATAAAGATAAPTDDHTALMFMLTNATAAPADASVAPAAQTYRLIANPTALTPLIGKKLALTGVLDPEDNADLAVDPSSGPGANAPVLRVKAGKVVAASCP